MKRLHLSLRGFRITQTQLHSIGQLARPFSSTESILKREELRPGAPNVPYMTVSELILRSPVG